MAVTIEAAGEHDIDALGALLQQLFAIEADFHFEPAKVRRALARLLEQESARLLVARSAGTVVGMCSAQLVISTAEGAYSAWVEDLVVDAAHRGQGIGQRLLEGITAWAQGQGATRLQLLADRENRPALDFYRGNGWQQTQLLALRTTLPS
jgi:GNAT superfamily N-acetyltransferase